MGGKLLEWEVMSKILVMRGGALGDFILSLPVLVAFKKEFPGAALEIMGYPRIAELARGRHYAQRVCSIDYAPLARFFGADSDLPDELCLYFAGFHQIVSFFYDPDDIFHGNLRKAGARHILQLIHKPDETKAIHAAEQFARGIEKIGIIPEDFTPRVYPCDADRDEARKILGTGKDFLIGLHPGSGSTSKNWPLENWITTIDWLLKDTPAQIALVFGEAETKSREAFVRYRSQPRIKFLDQEPLTTLAAALEQCRVFIGHDSGISHLAAAVGTETITLFGPTNPVLWQPVGAQVIQKGNRLEQIVFEDVQFALAKPLGLG